MLCSSRDAEHPGGPAKGHVAPPRLPAGEREGFGTTWPRDLAVSSLVFHGWKNSEAGAGARKTTVVSLSPNGDQTLEGNVFHGKIPWRPKVRLDVCPELPSSPVLPGTGKN